MRRIRSSPSSGLKQLSSDSGPCPCPFAWWVRDPPNMYSGNHRKGFSSFFGVCNQFPPPSPRAGIPHTPIFPPGSVFQNELGVQTSGGSYGLLLQPRKGPTLLTPHSTTIVKAATLCEGQGKAFQSDGKTS